MREQKRFIELTDFEWRLLIHCINAARSVYLDSGKPIEDVNDLLVKVIKSKIRKART